MSFWLHSEYMNELNSNQPPFAGSISGNLVRTCRAMLKEAHVSAHSKGENSWQPTSAVAVAFCYGGPCRAYSRICSSLTRSYFSEPDIKTVLSLRSLITRAARARKMSLKRKSGSELRN